MSATANLILERLATVEQERLKRLADPVLGERVVALKAFQQRRFARTYADLSASQRYQAVVRYFLDELYGPNDFTRRDAQFARVVPGMVRVFPQEVVETVATLAELHSLSELLDTVMASNLESIQFGASQYIEAWQRTGLPTQRALQVALTISVAHRLEHFTRMPLLRTSLRLMRVPAKAAGLSDLQRFLERGFDTFQAMGGAGEFISTVEARERALAAALFAAEGAGGRCGGTWLAALNVLPT